MKLFSYYFKKHRLTWGLSFLFPYTFIFYHTVINYEEAGTNPLVSAVLYVSVPEGSGNLVFRPKLNHRYHGWGATTIKPEKGFYYMFPGYLDHYVTRNQSDNNRISFSINFDK